jgi:hypothetical protein
MPNPPVSTAVRIGHLPAAGLLALALVGLGLAGLALLIGRPGAALLIGVGALLTASGGTLWWRAPERVVTGGLSGVVGILGMMAGCALGGT